MTVAAGQVAYRQRSFAMGVQGRYHLLLSSDGAASYLTAVARAEYIWGW